MGRGRVQKQLLIAAKNLAATSTGISPTHLSISVSSSSATPLAVFPPREAYLQPPTTSLQSKQFSPEIWAALQPPPTTALSAFAHRIGLATILDSPELVQWVCTHQSYTPFLQKYTASTASNRKVHDNAQLAYTGNTLMGLFAAEHVNATYPYLPTQVVKAVVTAYVGPLSCASVAQEMGATPLLRWHRQPRTPTNTKPLILHTDALASIPRAITGLIYQKRSLPSARQFVHSYFLSRKVDIRDMIKFQDPKKALAMTVAKFGRERPVSRLLKETGRFSNSPVFVVGIYSGADQLGEGFGTSLKMAEFRAAEDALHRLYLTQTPKDQIQLPTNTFPLGIGDVFRRYAPGHEGQGQGGEGRYVAPKIVEEDIEYASSGRSGVVGGPRGRYDLV